MLEEKIGFVIKIVMLLAFTVGLVACGLNQDSASQLSTSNYIAQVTPIVTTQNINTALSMATVVQKNANNEITITQSLSNDWQIRWLQGVPCSPPCWEGITPGATTAQQAISILKKNVLFEPSSIITRELKSSSYVVWYLMNGKEGGEAYYGSKSSNTVITSIRPIFDTSYKLKDIIQLYGEPEYVVATYSRGVETAAHFYDLSFSYVTKGFTLQSNTNGSVTMPTLSPEMYVKNPTFFVAIKNLKDFKPYSAVAWQGFEDFNFYCREPDHPDKPCT